MVGYPEVEIPRPSAARDRSPVAGAYGDPTILDVAASKLYDWRERYGKVN